MKTNSENQNQDGLELCLRFSYMPNYLQYCGPEKANKHFLSYLKQKKNANAIKQDIKGFEGLYPYLSAIASKSKGNYYDYNVIEAYWLGNSLLDKFSANDMKAIIQTLSKSSLPRMIAEKLIKEMPRGFMPHHNFNVFFVGVGQITGAVPTNIKNMNNCMIAPAKVMAVKKDKLVVSKETIVKNKSGYFFGRKKTIDAIYLKEMLPDVKKGDVVAVHWGFAAMKLNEKQNKNLLNYTHKILNVLNTINQ